MRSAKGGALDREILRLALPALLTLVAEPLFLLTDAAIVGHLGTPQLAGLGIAGVVLQTAVGLCIFLAYGTTAAVSRSLGAGDLRRALALGVDGLWLAVPVGRRSSPCSACVLAGPLVGAFGAERRGERPRRDLPADRVASASRRCSSCWPRRACCAACRTRAPRWSSPWPASR